MKVSQDLILGIAIGAGVALVFANKADHSGGLTPKLPSPKVPTLPAQSLAGTSWDNRRMLLAGTPWDNRRMLAGTPWDNRRIRIAMHPDWYRRRGIPGY